MSTETTPRRTLFNYLGGLVMLAPSRVGGCGILGPDDRADARKAIEKLLADQVAAWNKRDLEGFMATYWNSDELTFFSGKDRTHGWQATMDRYRKRYQAEGREMGTLSFSEIDLAMLSDESCLVRGRWQLVIGSEMLGGLYTLIVRKLPEGWRIVHDHTSG